MSAHLHYSLRTEQAYVHWVLTFVRCLRNPRSMGGPEVDAFLSRLSAERHVSVSTHRQASLSLLFHFGQQLPWMQAIDRPQLPAVLAPGLREQMHRARVLWQADARAGRCGVQMPDALERKYPRTCCSQARTSGRCRNCWVAAT